MNTTAQSSGSEERSWLWFVVLMIALLFLAVVRWMLGHPYAIHSDEAWYINEVQTDIHILRGGGLHQLARWIIHGDINRPPGYRLEVLPFVFLFGYHTLTVRLVTFACFLLSGCFVYLTTRRFAGPAASAIALLVFYLSPEIVQSSIFFSTEGPLFLGVAATLYFLSVYWTDAPAPFANWIGLGLAVGIGCNSKSTFESVAGPVLLFSAYAALRNPNRKRVSTLISLALAGALALIIAVPWWRANFRSALAYAAFGNTGWTRHSLGAHTLMLLLLWIGTVFVSLIGPGIGILIALIAIVFIQKAFLKKETLLGRDQRTALIACAFAGLPIAAAQLYGINDNLRLISVAMIPLAIAVGVLAGATGWARSKMCLAVSGLLFFAQLLMLVFPVLFPNKHLEDPGSFNGYPWTVMIRFEQWNWTQLHDLTDSCGIPTPKTVYMGDGRFFNGQYEYGWYNSIGKPKISYLGNGRAFNGSQIQYPWIAQGAPPPDVTWLWWEEQGPIDWQKVMKSVEQSDVVMTAPNYVGQITDREDVDNQHNAEFAAKLAQDPNFQGPIHLVMSQLDPVDVDVFVKNAYVCR